VSDEPLRLARPLAGRSAGVLLHLTSLPGSGPLGRLDEEPTDRFLDWLRQTRQAVWQMLPVTVAGPAGSPYDGRSATALEPGLTGVEDLARVGLLAVAGGRPDEPAPRSRPPIEIARARAEPALRAAWAAFRERGHRGIEAAWDGMQRGEDAASVADWALFDALRARFEGRPWWQWDLEIRRARPRAVAEARRSLAPEIDFRRFIQAVLHWQWTSLRQRARARGIELHGDLPIYVSRDSADVWLHRHLFEVGNDGELEAQGGVPPDYFSATGQAWGLPPFRWESHREEGYAWWANRLRVALTRFDRVRIDHFRGLVAYWRIPAGAPDARTGAWVDGPGRELFEAIHRRLGPLSLVAENLGMITPDVEALRESLGMPGVRVLQFAFDEEDSPHLPHHHRPDDVVFTGTHDNPPTATWYRRLGPEPRRRFRRLTGRAGPAHRRLARLALGSVASLAILPAQDVLGLGARARMNTPATTAGNWRWRLDGWEGLQRVAEWLAPETEGSGRGE
jgi:4-alpha-glucanotransferase